MGAVSLSLSVMSCLCIRPSRPISQVLLASLYWLTIENHLDRCKSSWSASLSVWTLQACDFSADCAAKGLHAHHPRDCLYHLRDWSVPRLLSLLQVRLNVHTCNNQICKIVWYFSCAVSDLTVSTVWENFPLFPWTLLWCVVEIRIWDSNKRGDGAELIRTHICHFIPLCFVFSASWRVPPVRIQTEARRWAKVSERYPCRLHKSSCKARGASKIGIKRDKST